MAFLLDIDIKVSNDGTKMWVIDNTLDYGVNGNVAISDIISLNVTFLKQNPTTKDYSDIITEDKNLNLRVSGLVSQSQMVLEITPKDVWGTDTTQLFTDGIYYLHYYIVASSGKYPINNSSFSNKGGYIYSEVIIASLKNYYNKLLLKLAREMTLNKIDTSYLTDYTTLLGTKLDALKETINVGVIPSIRAGITYLQSLITKYPDYNGFNRYYKSPYRN